MIDYITIIGLLAGTLSIVAYIPQVWKTYITKRSKDLSMKWLILTVMSQLLWFIFGTLSNVLPIILTSSLSCIMSSSLIIMKKKYDD